MRTEEHNNRRAEVRERLIRLHTFNFGRFLDQPNKWGPLNFSELSDDFELRMKPILDLLINTDLMTLSLDQLKVLEDHLLQIDKAIHDISQFSIEAPEAGAKRSALLTQAQRALQKFEAYISGLSVPLLLEHLSSGENHQKFEVFFSEMEEKLQSATTTLESILSAKKDIENIRENVREAAADVGIETHATIFETESQSLRKQSYWWLAATALLLAGTTFAAAYFYTNPSFALGDVTIALQIIVPKVLLLGLLLSVTVWCGRNYRALAHEAAVNKHRANALSTFRTFVDASSEQDVRNAVLLEATRAIFSQAPSGYLDKSDNSGSDNRVTEVVRSLNSATRMTT
ncbi:MAG: hypothetical protein ABJL17_03715 [Parvibaculum sp.]|uniref:hypothetical protein n=1 Tax=Parvibaculum sp. TaxID=2024848 RepID=UPI003266644D